ncbi:hypothetical protein [Planctomicrobium sp. SH664]|uniref:hypothetical protein n=1 Tax=Planctomicrobium sp. SH664 TaxID=3448125 RepID=UPI003F5C22C9
MRFTCFKLRSLGACLLLLGGSLAAQDIQPVVVLENLDNPSGLALQPESRHIFLSDRSGVYRVTRKEQQTNLTPEITGYPTDIYGKGPMYNIGPLGIGFLDESTLVVGDGSRPDGDEVIRIYKVGKKPASSPVAEAKAEFTLGPITAGEASVKGEGNYYAVASNGEAVFVTSNGDDTKGWVVRASITDGKPGKLEPFIATKQSVDTDAPCGIAISPEGDLVVSQMGEVNVAGDSLITIYDAKTGAFKKSYKTGLNDIVNIAYSPDGKLYGVDFSWVDPSQGGLYELTIDGDTLTPRKIVSLDKPTALAFTRGGALLVTVFGTEEAGSDKKPGKLLRIRSADLK